MAKGKQRFETLALHGGAYRADPVSGAVAVPIYQTTSYQFQDTGPPRVSSLWKSLATFIPASRTRPGTRSKLASRRWKAAQLRWRLRQAKRLRPIPC